MQILALALLESLGHTLVEQKQKITSLLKETIILYFLTVTEEIVVIIKIMEVLNSHLTMGITIFMLI